MESEAQTMPFWDHLEEFRWVILKSLIAVVVGIAVVWHFADALLALFRAPMQRLAGPVELIMLTPLDGFFIRFRLSTLGGLLLAMPFILGIVWSFVAPGLTARERRVVWGGLMAGLVFFCVGAFLGYQMLSIALPFLYSFRVEDIRNLWSVGRYLGFCTQLMAAMGVVFEVPVVLMILIRLDVLGAAALRGGRPYAYVVAFIMAAFLTPPDIVTQILVGIPLLAMFEACLLFATWRERKHAVQ